MKRAFYTGTCPHATYEEIVHLAQGADGLEIQLNEEGSAFGLSRGELHLAAACFREHGLPVVDLITHINFVDLVQKGKEALDLANLLDAKAICVTLGNKLVRHNDPLEYDHMGLVKSLRELWFLCRRDGPFRLGHSLQRLYHYLGSVQPDPGSGQAELRLCLECNPHRGTGSSPLSCSAQHG